jgi:hypothetical protein
VVDGFAHRVGDNADDVSGCRTRYRFAHRSRRAGTGNPCCPLLRYECAGGVDARVHLVVLLVASVVDDDDIVR